VINFCDIDDLLTSSPHTVLDVGCGTGIASRLLVDRGCQLLGVEPDPQMAALARARHLVVEEAVFEPSRVSCTLGVL